MPSPFPGMDPFLEDEKIWPVFQHQLITCCYQTLLPSLVDRYRARIHQRVYVTEEPLFTSIIRQERVEEFIEIRQRTDGRLITVIEMVSPTNKTTAQGRLAYLETRKTARAENANMVEVDLVFQGRPMLDYSREGLPDNDYAVSVTRSIQPDRYEIYTSTLQKRLPRFKIPLASDDRDVVFDLQAAFTRCFDQGLLSNLIDYSKNPAVKLADEDLDFIDELLKHRKLRT